MEANLKILSGVSQRTGAKILLALKCFSAFCVFPLISRYLAGVCASGLDEARLGREEFSGEVHAGAPAFRDEEFDELLSYCDHVVFNSFSQWEMFRKRACVRVSCGMRVNPEHSEVKTAIYDLCGPFSRLGVTRANFRADLLDGIDGLHFFAIAVFDERSTIFLLYSSNCIVHRLAPAFVIYGGFDDERNFYLCFRCGECCARNKAQRDQNTQKSFHMSSLILRMRKCNTGFLGRQQFCAAHAIASRRFYMSDKVCP